MSSENTSNYDPIKEKAEARENFEQRLRLGGNLESAEIKELVDFEFEGGLDSVQKQVRRYYLKLKSEYLSAARFMFSDVGIVGEDDQLSDGDVQRIKNVVEQYISGAVINFRSK